MKLPKISEDNHQQHESQYSNGCSNAGECWHVIAHPRTSCIVGQEITHKMTLNTTHNRVPRIASTDSRGHRNARLVCIPASFLFIFCMSLHHNETNPRTHIHGSKSARHYLCVLCLHWSIKQQLHSCGTGVAREQGRYFAVLHRCWHRVIH